MLYSMNGKQSKVMVFGVFDGLHQGHRWFLREARKQGDELIVVVASDETVRLLKKKNPAQSESERLRALEAIPELSRAVLGDAQMGSYAVLKKYQPDVICLGYDQDALAEDLAMRMKNNEIPRSRLVRIKAHKAHRYHSSLLTKSKK